MTLNPGGLSLASPETLAGLSHLGIPFIRMRLAVCARQIGVELELNTMDRETHKGRNKNERGDRIEDRFLGQPVVGCDNRHT